MTKTVSFLFLASLLVTGFSPADAAQKSRRATRKPKTADPTFRKIEIPPGTVERTEPEIRKAATRRVTPEYPSIDCKHHVQGDVVVIVLVGEDGKVIDAAAKSGHPLLAKAAVAGARRWEFQPFLKDGQPVKFTGTLTFRFRLGS